jgi:hypothetical protein
MKTQGIAWKTTWIGDKTTLLDDENNLSMLIEQLNQITTQLWTLLGKKLG